MVKTTSCGITQHGVRTQRQNTKKQHQHVRRHAVRNVDGCSVSCRVCISSSHVAIQYCNLHIQHQHLYHLFCYFSCLPCSITPCLIFCVLSCLSCFYLLHVAVYSFLLSSYYIVPMMDLELSLSLSLCLRIHSYPVFLLVPRALNATCMCVLFLWCSACACLCVCVLCGVMLFLFFCWSAS